MNAIKKLWKLLVDDTKSDIATLQKLANEGITESQKQGIKEFFKPGGINWGLLSFMTLFCLLTLVLGWMFAGAYYTKQCNDFVQAEVDRLQEWQGSRGFSSITETPLLPILNNQEQNQTGEQDAQNNENDLQPLWNK